MNRKKYQDYQQALRGMRMANEVAEKYGIRGDFGEVYLELIDATKKAEKEEKGQ